MSGLADHTASPASDEEATTPSSQQDVASPASQQDVAPLTSEQASERDVAPPAEETRAGHDSVTASPGLRERARIRRRARFLRQLREVQLRDLGGFLVEQLRLGRDNPAVVQAKLEEAAATDSELRALDRTLTQGAGIRELREAGIGGACAGCGTVHGSSDRYCSWCGRKL